MKLKNKVAIITGASSGIGRALAIAMSQEGASVVLAARNKEKLDEVVTDIKYQGLEAMAVQCDVSNENDCKNLILNATEKYGRLDILVNNAGVSMRALFRDTRVDVLKKLMDINFWGMVYCTKYAMPYLLGSKGSVVGVSSVAGYKGLPGRTGYSSSKFAMHGFLEALRIENLKTGLHVLIACPGFTASNIRNTALNENGEQQGESPRDEGKMMSAEEVAKHIIYAIVKRKDRIVLTSQGKTTVGINKFFPRFMDKMVYQHMAKEPDSPFN
jgi:short-subunit dehydrogenase